MVYVIVFLKSGGSVYFNLFALVGGAYRGVDPAGNDVVIPQSEVETFKLAEGNNDFYGKSTSGYDEGIGYG